MTNRNPAYSHVLTLSMLVCPAQPLITGALLMVTVEFIPKIAKPAKANILKIDGTNLH